MRKYATPSKSSTLKRPTCKMNAFLFGCSVFEGNTFKTPVTDRTAFE